MSAREAVVMGAAEPVRDCSLCIRLAAFRKANRKREPEWFNAPVPNFGPRDARLLIVGLAPGLKGANRTGRPFTGDFAGDLLYGTLLEFGFAVGKFEARIDDTLKLVDARIANAVRCVPPENKPTPAEIRTCNRFLAPTIAGMPQLAAIVALGRVAHDAVAMALSHKRARIPFAHGSVHRLARDPEKREPDFGKDHAQNNNYEHVMLFDSYHCSRYNTNTGVLTPAMFRAVFRSVHKYLDGRDQG